MACTLASVGVVIMRRCTSETRPSGKRIATSTRGEPRKASIAAPPVSPEVAPMMVARWPRVASTRSMSRASSCMATSLKASVGPWNSSRIQRLVPTCTSGVTAGWPKRAYASVVMRRSSSREMAPPVNGWITSTATSANGMPANEAIVSGASTGHDCGM